MNTNILALASGLSDHDLLTRLLALAGKEREATVELVAHLAALDSRPSVYAAKGFGSLFSYCVEALRLSEDATCNRIYAARACRRFPKILEALAAGEMSLTSVRMLSPHLTDENWQTVLARAAGRSRRDIEALVAELAPRPDVPSSVRKLPTPAVPPSTNSMQPIQADAIAPSAPSASLTGAPPPDHRSDVAPTLPRPVHDRRRESRQAAPPSGAPPSGDSRRRPRRDRRPCPDAAPREGRTTEAGGGGEAPGRAPYPPRNGYAGLADHPQFPRHPERREAGVMAPRWRAMWIRLGGWSSVHRAHVPGVPSRDSVCDGWSGDDRQHLAALPAAQSVRGRGGIRLSTAREP